MEVPPAQWWRIHRAIHGSCYYSDDARNRFSSPGFGVLYLGDKPETALWEIYWDDLIDRPPSERRISERKLRERAICTATLKGAGHLRVFNATSPIAMKAISAPTGTFTSEYTNCQAWARALFSHPEKPDGIIYPSARTPGAKCLALFGARTGCDDVTFAPGTALVDNVDIMHALLSADVRVLRT